jgi:hypothetical protein
LFRKSARGKDADEQELVPTDKTNATYMTYEREGL